MQLYPNSLFSDLLSNTEKMWANHNRPNFKN